MAKYLASLDSATSRRTMANALDLVTGQPGVKGRPGLAAARASWHALGPVELQALRARLVARYAPATTNRMLAAIRGVLRAARALRLIDREGLEDRLACLKVARGHREPRGRLITEEEQRRLFGAVRPGPLGARDVAIVAVALMGLRRAEIAGLPLDAYDVAAGSLRVLGKRNKERQVPLAAGAQRAVSDWLRVRGTEAGPLFVRFTPTGAQTGEGITPQAVYEVLRGLARRAGLSGLSPHDFRRTLISAVLDSGDVSAAQKLAGHESVATTLRYDRRGERAKKAAVEKVHIPYGEGEG